MTDPLDPAGYTSPTLEEARARIVGWKAPGLFIDARTLLALLEENDPRDALDAIDVMERALQGVVSRPNDMQCRLAVTDIYGLPHAVAISANVPGKWGGGTRDGRGWLYLYADFRGSEGVGSYLLASGTTDADKLRRRASLAAFSADLRQLEQSTARMAHGQPGLYRCSRCRAWFDLPRGGHYFAAAFCPTCWTKPWTEAERHDGTVGKTPQEIERAETYE